jgi:hypothetical protein
MTAVVGLAGVVSLFAAPIASSAGDSETLTVDANNPAGATTTRALQAGVTYTVSATGTYSWGLAGGTADAECSSLPPDPSAQPNRLSFLYANDDNFDVYVGGAKVDWQPASGAASDGPCDAKNAYRLALTPATTGPVTFAVVDKTNSAKSGRVTVTVSAPAPANATQTASGSSGAIASTTTPRRSTKVLGAGTNRTVVSVAAPAPSITVPTQFGGRPLRPTTTPTVPSRTFSAQFHAIKAPTLPDRPFHVTALGWLAIVVTLVVGTSAIGFFFATRADAVDSALRSALMTVMRTVVGRGSSNQT